MTSQQQLFQQFLQLFGEGKTDQAFELAQADPEGIVGGLLQFQVTLHQQGQYQAGISPAKP